MRQHEGFTITTQEEHFMKSSRTISSSISTNTKVVQPSRNWPSIIVNSIEVIRRYRNWLEILESVAKKQFPTRLILKDGTQFETAGGWKWRGLVEEIFFERAYLPTPLHIEANDIVVDIGAHVGVFSIFAASITHNKVYAFEPFPSSYEILT